MKQSLFKQLPKPGEKKQPSHTSVARDFGYLDGDRPGDEYQERWFFVTQTTKRLKLSDVFAEFKSRWPNWYSVTAVDHGDYIEVWGEMIVND